MSVDHIDNASCATVNVRNRYAERRLANDIHRYCRRSTCRRNLKVVRESPIMSERDCNSRVPDEGDDRSSRGVCRIECAVSAKACVLPGESPRVDHIAACLCRTDLTNVAPRMALATAVLDGGVARSCWSGVSFNATGLMILASWLGVAVGGSAFSSASTLVIWVPADSSAATYSRTSAAELSVVFGAAQTAGVEAKSARPVKSPRQMPSFITILTVPRDVMNRVNRTGMAKNSWRHHSTLSSAQQPRPVRVVITPGSLLSQADF